MQTDKTHTHTHTHTHTDQAWLPSSDMVTTLYHDECRQTRHTHTHTHTHSGLEQHLCRKSLGCKLRMRVRTVFILSSLHPARERE